ncbi:hypothetical protein LIER_43711 [Lithospermum erythrorhizon]|uniref:Uncharacterized protein n=1 Tax=Lithospermum erythrorhizon TaxID=34254 RepID=A0AAV3QR06_LITER
MTLQASCWVSCMTLLKAWIYEYFLAFQRGMASGWNGEPPRVRWTPYGPVKDDLVSYYHGWMCIMADTCVLFACSRSYKKIYGDHDAMWDQLSTHSFRPEEFGLLVIDTREFTTDHHMHWYESYIHVRVSNLVHEGAPPDVPAIAPLATSYSRDAL